MLLSDAMLWYGFGSLNNSDNVYNVNSNGTYGNNNYSNGNNYGVRPTF